jgi:hypothetical protein
MADTVEIDIVARVENAISGLESLITSAGAAYLSISTLKKIVEDSFNAYEQAESAQLKLGAALKSTGQYSDSASQSLINYSKELQEVSTFSHVAIESSEALLLSIAHLSVEGIQEIMPHLMDFSAQYGVALPDAARMAAAAIEGGRNGFMQYGISVKDAHDPTERFNALIEALTNNVNGASDAFTKSTQGQIKQFTNQINDAKEATGGFFAYFAQGYISWFDNFLGGLKMVGGAAKDLASIWADITNLRNPFDANGLMAYYHQLDVIKTTTDEMRKSDEQAANKSKGIFAPKKEQAPLFNEGQGKEIQDMQDAYQSLFDTIKEGQDLIEEYNPTTKLIFTNDDIDSVLEMAKAWNEVWSDALKKSDDEAKKFSETLIKDVGGDIEKVGDALGKALVTGDWTGVLKSLGDEVVKLIEQWAILAACQSVPDWPMVALFLGIAGVAAIGGGALDASNLGGGSGGSGGSLSLPHYASGTDYVPRTGPAIVHQGEQIIPAGASGRGSTINMHIYGGMWQADDLARTVARQFGRW